MMTFFQKLSSQHILRWLSVALVGTLGVLVVTILGSAILTVFFNVPMGDDYLAIDMYSNRHTWLAETFHTLTNTSRYAQGLLGSISYGLFRENITYILPIVVIAWMYLLLFFYQKLLYSRLNFVSSNTFIAVVSAAVLALLLSSGRAVDANHVWLFYQSFYFSSAIVTYTLAILSYATLFYTFIRYPSFLGKKSRIRLITFTASCFLLGLFNETAPATLFGLGVVGLLLSFTKIPYLNALRSGRAYLIAASGTSLLALFTMYLTPANSGRREATGAAYSDSLIGPIFENIREVLGTMTNRPSDIILIFAVSLMTYIFIKPKRKGADGYSSFTFYGALLVIAGLLSLFAAITLLTVGYGAYTSIYPRALLLMQILWVTGGWLLSFGLIGLILNAIPQRFKMSLSIFILATGLLGLIVVAPHTISKSAHHIGGVQDYQAKWLQQDRILRDADKKNPTSTIYLEDSGAGIGDGFSVQCKSPYSVYTIWLTDAMEAYYGVREICAKSDLEKR